jgi:asparagine synthetase B (glutamine-hydrolysing)
VRPLRVVGDLDATFAWDGDELCLDVDLAPGSDLPSTLRGQAATASSTSGASAWRIVRDPLGLNKLFWATRTDGELLVAARPWLLLEEGHPLEEIAAVPRGLVLDCDSGGEIAGSLVPEEWSASLSAELDVEAAGREVGAKLDRYLAAIAARHRGAPAFVCLSGGLDSSSIAVLVADHFPDAAAVSFDLERPRGAASDDRQVAKRLAGDLGLPLLEATVSTEELLEPLDTVLREGIDWRDFNVHAALVNAALARAIADASGSADQRPLVFTGDLANEFLADYHPESYRGETYYALPRLQPLALRSLLVRGLDTCHREVGVFGAWRLAVVQPYAVAVDDYMRLPGGVLSRPDRKERLCGAMLGDRIPGYVLSRPKTRAQVGGDLAAGGVLTACVDRGIDAAFLRQRFATLHEVSDERSLDRFIRAGRYRAAVPAVEERTG